MVCVNQVVLGPLKAKVKKHAVHACTHICTHTHAHAHTHTHAHTHMYTHTRTHTSCWDEAAEGETNGIMAKTKIILTITKVLKRKHVCGWMRWVQWYAGFLSELHPVFWNWLRCENEGFRNTHTLLHSREKTANIIRLWRIYNTHSFVRKKDVLAQLATSVCSYIMVFLAPKASIFLTGTPHMRFLQAHTFSIHC